MARVAPESALWWSLAQLGCAAHGATWRDMRAWPGLDRIIASLTQCWLQNVLRPFGTGPLHHRQSGHGDHEEDG